MTDEIALLEVKDLQKYYEDGYHAVRGVSYKIGSGLLVGLIGPNGCGKTTMMKCINRLHDPTSGNIFIDGESVLNKSPGEVAKIVAKRLGFVYIDTGAPISRTYGGRRRRMRHSSRNA